VFYNKIRIDGLSGGLINKVITARYYPKAVKVLALG
jgi:hypothetical protein